jgi:hypothetical protein
VSGRSDWGVDSATQTLPPGAGPTDPRVVIGPDIPPELAAYVAGLPGGGSCVFAFLYYLDGTNYRWEALCEFGPTVLNVLRGATLNGTIEHFETEDFQLTGTRVSLFYGQGSMMDTFRLGLAALGLEIDYATGIAEANGPWSWSDAADTLTLRGDRLSCRHESTNILGMSAGTQTSTTYANLPGSPAVTIDKLYAAGTTELEVFISGTIEIDAVNGTGFEVGVLIGGTTYGITGLWEPSCGDAGEHVPFAGQRKITGIAAGSRTVTGRWRIAVAGGGRQLATSGADYFSMEVREVAA